MRNDIYLKFKTAAGGWMIVDVLTIKDTPIGKSVIGVSPNNKKNFFLGSVSDKCKIVKYNYKYDTYETIN
jgi:hypothetical protein